MAELNRNLVKTGLNYRIDSDDVAVIAAIREITSRGNDAEVRRKANGKLAVYELKKKMWKEPTGNRAG